MPARARPVPAAAGRGRSLTGGRACAPRALMPRRRRRSLARLPARARSLRTAHAAVRHPHMNTDGRAWCRDITVLILCGARGLISPKNRYTSQYYYNVHITSAHCELLLKCMLGQHCVKTSSESVL